MFSLRALCLHMYRIVCIKLNRNIRKSYALYRALIRCHVANNLGWLQLIQWMVRDPSESSTYYTICKYGCLTHSCSLQAVTAFLCDRLSLAGCCFALSWQAGLGQRSQHCSCSCNRHDGHLTAFNSIYRQMHDASDSALLCAHLIIIFTYLLSNFWCYNNSVVYIWWIFQEIIFKGLRHIAESISTAEALVLYNSIKSN